MTNQQPNYREIAEKISSTFGSAARRRKERLIARGLNEHNVPLEDHWIVRHHIKTLNSSKKQGQYRPPQHPWDAARIGGEDL